MTKIAAIRLQKWINAESLREHVRIVNIVHDEIVVESDSKYADVVKAQLEKEMITSGSFFCKTVPMVVDAKITEVWDH